MLYIIELLKQETSWFPVVNLFFVYNKQDMSINKLGLSTCQEGLFTWSPRIVIKSGTLNSNKEANNEANIPIIKHLDEHIWKYVTPD